MYQIKYSKLSGTRNAEINTIFCKMSRDDKQLLINLLQDALYVIGEAQHEFTEIDTFVTKQFKCFGKGQYNKKAQYLGVNAILCGMLKQHKKTKDKDFTIYQIKNIEKLLGAFDKINGVLVANKWPETIFAPDIEFVEI